MNTDSKVMCKEWNNTRNVLKKPVKQLLENKNLTLWSTIRLQMQFLRKSAPSSGCCVSKITVRYDRNCNELHRSYMKIKVLKAEF